MKRENYTIEYCLYCDQEVAIRSYGITACPKCGKPLAPCSVCKKVYCDPCPWGCKYSAEDKFLTITNSPMTVEEIAFAQANC